MKKTFVQQHVFKTPSGFILCSLAFLFVCFNQVSAQDSVFYGTVVNTDGEALVGATIENKRLGRATISDRRGDFYIAIDSLSVLEIRYVGYKTAVIKDFSASDTIREFIEMDKEIENLREFEVQSNRFKPIAKDDAINVLDYVPYREFVLALESRGRKRYLSFYQEPDSVRRLFTGRIKGKSLFEDCFGNIHILNDDSAYQVYDNGVLHIIAAISIEEFDKNIRPCVAKFGDNTFFERYSRFNKKYSFVSYDPDSKKPTTHLSVWDEIGAAMAREEYDSIIRLYFSATSPVENIILNKSWDGDIISLANTPALTAKIGWYTKVLLRSVEVKTFSMREHLVAFNCFSDSLSVMNQSGKTIYVAPFGDGTEKVKEILFDPVTQAFYLFKLEGISQGMHFIELSTGKKKFMGSTKGFGRAENLKIFDDELYFIVKENGYGDLYRMALDDLK